MNQLTKKYKGMVYEWDGSSWSNVDDRTEPAGVVVNALEQILTDEERAAWQRVQAMTPGLLTVSARFCRGCGRYFRHPTHPNTCSECGRVGLDNRKYCEYCGRPAAGDCKCPSCGRRGERP